MCEMQKVKRASRELINPWSSSQDKVLIGNQFTFYIFLLFISPVNQCDERERRISSHISPWLYDWALYPALLLDDDEFNLMEIVEAKLWKTITTHYHTNSLLSRFCPNILNKLILFMNFYLRLYRLK